MKSYEYTCQNYYRKTLFEIINALNEMGKDGWELISHPTISINGVDNGSETFLFKREQKTTKVKK